MNNILELIRNEEVKWVSLGEVFKNIVTGKLNANKREENGIYPFYTCDEKPYRINTYAFDCEALLVSGNGSKVGHINYYKGKFNAYQRTYVLYDLKENNDIKYIYYYLKFALKKYLNNNIFKGSIPFITMPILTEFKIPIPSLETQRKIVDILDRYTKSYEELKECLAKEKDLRIKQYEYYRDKLLTEEYLIKKTKELCKIDVSLKQLCIKDVVKIKNGKDWKNLNKGDVPVYGSGGEMNIYVDKYMYDKDSVLIPRKGSINNVFYLDKPFWNIDTIFYTEINEKELIPKYFYYFISNYNIGALSSINSSTRPSLTQSQLNEILITLPPLKVQEHIVEILDKFNKLTNDIKEGLPKEIELRTKQYEYYREKLLDFKK